MKGYKKFGEMTKEEQLDIFKAWQDGESEVSYKGTTWNIADYPHFTLYFYYRRKPKPAINLDWNKVPEGWDWCALSVINATNWRKLKVFSLKPVFSDGAWFCRSGYPSPTFIPFDFAVSTGLITEEEAKRLTSVHTEDSLTTRPT